MTTSGLTVVIPDHIWHALLVEFAKHGGTVERVAYFDGYVADMTGYPDPAPIGVVASLVLPDATLTPGNYQVTAAAMSEAGTHLRGRRMVRLAQIHTHGNDAVGHSPTDDADAYSQRLGAISIVVPWHAALNPTLADCGIHLRTADGWELLSPAEAAATVSIEPTLYDYRNPTWHKTSQPNTGTFSRWRRWLTPRRRSS